MHVGQPKAIQQNATPQTTSFRPRNLCYLRSCVLLDGLLSSGWPSTYDVHVIKNHWSVLLKRSHIKWLLVMILDFTNFGGSIGPWHLFLWMRRNAWDYLPHFCTAGPPGVKKSVGHTQKNFWISTSTECQTFVLMAKVAQSVKCTENVPNALFCTC